MDQCLLNFSCIVKVIILHKQAFCRDLREISCEFSFFEELGVWTAT